MILYFVVEGRHYEKKIYKKWIPYLKSQLNYVDTVADLKANSFYIVSGNGYPQYKLRIRDACADINNLGNIDCLFICVDTEESKYEARLNEINEYIRNECPPINCEIIVIIQNKCIECWLMGNKDIDISNTSNHELVRYRNNYNVNVLDPEKLTSINNRTIGEYAKRYLILMLRENGLRYTRNSVRDVATHDYFIKLLERFEDDEHIKTFQYFVNEFLRISS